MINAQQELLKHVEGKQVDFVKIVCQGSFSHPPLRIEGTLEEVLPLLNFNYDNGYGGQELYGYIWYKDGTWSDRGEYDGAEWWQHQKAPDRNIEIDP